MTTVTRNALAPSLASIALVLASPDVLAGQSLSARPASVALTIVVPPHAQPDLALGPDGVAVVRRTPSAVDFEALVPVGDRSPSRVEVRLGSPWAPDSTRVWVRDSTGAFEQLLTDASVVALEAPLASSVQRSTLRFRVESSQPSLLASIAIPVEYRLTIGAGDQIVVWNVRTVLRFESAR